jgi:hypothetical protein
MQKEGKLVEVIFAQRVLIGVRLARRHSLSAGLGVRGWGLAFDRLPCWLHDNNFEDVPQRADAKHIAGDVERAANPDVESKQKNESANADQQTPDQPQSKRLVHNLRVLEKRLNRWLLVMLCSPDDSREGRKCLL